MRMIAQRERLEFFSSFRFSFDEISFTSPTSQRGGGKATVVQATVRREAGNEEIVAVKKLNYHNGTKIQKLSKVSVDRIAVFLAA